MKKLIFLFLVLIFINGCTNNKICYEEGTSCCTELNCRRDSITCIFGTRPVFLGCDEDCRPQWECQEEPERFSTDIEIPEEITSNIKSSQNIIGSLMDLPEDIGMPPEDL